MKLAGSIDQASLNVELYVYVVQALACRAIDLPFPTGGTCLQTKTAQEGVEPYTGSADVHLHS
ncbi:hypothetical protein PSN_5658 [Pseudomonas sp. NGC7]